MTEPGRRVYKYNGFVYFPYSANTPFIKPAPLTPSKIQLVYLYPRKDVLDFRCSDSESSGSIDSIRSIDLSAFFSDPFFEHMEDFHLQLLADRCNSSGSSISYDQLNSVRELERILKRELMEYR